MIRLGDWKAVCAVFLLGCATAIASSAQTFTTLWTFNGTDGLLPVAPLAQGRDGNLYGTTASGGANNYGEVFKITPEGKLNTLYSFCTQTNCPDGDVPEAGLVLAPDGNFYGTTASGGAFSLYGGTVFKITPKGELTTLHSFNGIDGYSPYGGLVQAIDGNFYGETGSGNGRYGTIFKITPSGKLTTLYSFYSPADGETPIGGLIQGRDGNFYGVTYQGGVRCSLPVDGCGTVFKITPRGTLTTLHAFHGTDGALPVGGLIQGNDGNFYGATLAGGTGTNCQGQCGTVFKITPNGVLTTLHSFNNIDGAVPDGGLFQAIDSNYYGTTSQGGDLSCIPGGGCGTLFQITPGGSLTVVHSFDCADSSYPEAAMVQATNGNFYGTTYGLYCSPGTVFSLSMGLGPFAAFVRNFGKVAETIDILGQGFIGTTRVLLAGTPANFKVISDTFLRAQVPAGGTTGFVTVTTPGGTLTSNKAFRVMPQLLSFDPPKGPVGTQVTITGVSLTQTQGVGFGDRIPAQFTVNSDTQVTATVPSGAKTGKVGIETKGGIAISSGTFTVTQ